MAVPVSLDPSHLAKICPTHDQGKTDYYCQACSDLACSDCKNKTPPPTYNAAIQADTAWPDTGG